ITSTLSSQLYYLSTTCILSFFFYCYADHRDLHSFPTRRSSDLTPILSGFTIHPVQRALPQPGKPKFSAGAFSSDSAAENFGYLRSEEHTSELQSRGHLVCRLLLEKKKRSEREDTFRDKREKRCS